MMSQPEIGHPRLAVLTLLLLAPFVGEFVLGNISITAEWPALIMLAPLYGGGALVIREVARRRSRGWPTVVVLGIAYGTIEAGLLDQSLFSPPDIEGVAAETLYVPALGFDLANYATFVGGHVVWSLWIPIVVVESVFGRTPAQQRSPWLRRRGLGLAVALYLLGCGILLAFTVSAGLVTVRTGQAVGVGLAVLVLVAMGLALPAPRPVAAGWVPRARWLAVGCFLAATVAFLAPEGLWTLLVRLALGAAAVATLGRWSRRPGWTSRHRVAAATGALLVYTYTGFVLTALYGRTGLAVWLGQAVVALVSVLGVVGLVVVVRTRDRARRPPGRAAGSHAQPVG